MSTASSTKHESSPRRGLTSMVPVIVAFGVASVCFVLVAIYSEARASALDREAKQIETNALPSVEHLAAAQTALRHLELASDRYVEEPGEGGSEAATAMGTARGELERELALALATDQYPGEAELQASIEVSVGELDRLLARMRELAAADGAQARLFARHQLRSATEQVDTTMGSLMSVNATQGRAEAGRIAGIRAKSVRFMYELNLACMAFSALAAFIAVRALQRQRSIELAHDDMLESRAAELERFAARVAHDLLSPLSALAFTLSSLKRNADRGLPIAEPLERAGACLKRSQALVDGVMDFARSGGSPAGGRANLRATLDGTIDEARTDAAGVEFVVESFDADVFIACAAGVLTSILSNLVRNAVKYMDDRPQKRITIRASASAVTVRVEVEDTGPGLPPGLEQHVFEPYVRSPDNPKPGLGLGLATVQRFVESHRGRVGVASSPGQGCAFWFELPRVGGGDVSER